MFHNSNVTSPSIAMPGMPNASSSEFEMECIRAGVTCTDDQRQDNHNAVSLPNNPTQQTPHYSISADSGMSARSSSNKISMRSSAGNKDIPLTIAYDDPNAPAASMIVCDPANQTVLMIDTPTTTQTPFTPALNVDAYTTTTTNKNSSRPGTAHSNRSHHSHHSNATSERPQTAWCEVQLNQELSVAPEITNIPKALLPKRLSNTTKRVSLAQESMVSVYEAEEGAPRRRTIVPELEEALEMDKVQQIGAAAPRRLTVGKNIYTIY